VFGDTIHSIMSKKEKIEQLQAEFGATQSVIEPVLDSAGGDMERAREFFKNVEVLTPFEQQVNFLMDTISIPGLPPSVYADVLTKCNEVMSDALDMMTKIQQDMEREEAERKKKQQEEMERRKKEQEEMERRSQEEIERKKQEEIERRKQRKEEKEREKKQEMEMKKRLVVDLKDKIQTMKKALEDRTISDAEAQKLMDQVQKSVIQMSKITSKDENPVPDYMIGRLPSEKCAIKAEVNGKTITFSWSIPKDEEVHEKDWIGLFVHDRQYGNKYHSYVVLEGKHDGTHEFEAPTDGYYDLRYFPKGGYFEESRSKPILVGESMPVVAKLEGHKIAVSWNREQEKKNDWVGLYRVGTYSNKQWLGKTIYASAANSDGKVFFDTPCEPGKYEVRYFFTRNSYDGTYVYSGVSDVIELPNPNLDSMEVLETHPVTKVKWQTCSQEPNSRDWIGIFPSKETAKPMAWVYLPGNDDHGVAEIVEKSLNCLAPEGELPPEAENWEVRLYKRACSAIPFLCIPFLKSK